MLTFAITYVYTMLCRPVAEEEMNFEGLISCAILPIGQEIKEQDPLWSVCNFLQEDSPSFCLIQILSD